MVQAAATLRAAGADVEIPNPVFEREQFDAALIAEPKPTSGVTQQIRELGVA